VIVGALSILLSQVVFPRIPRWLKRRADPATNLIVGVTRRLHQLHPIRLTPWSISEMGMLRQQFASRLDKI
jgi:hypothetical protein